MQVREVMTTLVHCCQPQDPLSLAARLMWEHDCGALPVVDGERRAVAMLTDRDICMAAYTRGLPLADLRVAEAMSKTLVDCRVDEPLAAAGARMAAQQVHRLPVLDAERRVVGLLSINDLAVTGNERSVVLPADQPLAAAITALRGISHHRDRVPTVVLSTPPKTAPAQPARVAARTGLSPTAVAP
jgi:CBS domain-containing protein